MPLKNRAVIVGTGSYIPENVISNDHFLSYDFYEESGVPLEKDNKEVIEKFVQITEIEERRYVNDSESASGIATKAGRVAIEDAGLQADDIDYVIAAHNFGDVVGEYNQTDIMPCISSRIKHNLGIQNRKCKTYDMIFGCPGWLEALILGAQMIELGKAKNVLVTGADTLSKVVDKHDRNAMIFADGAAAVVLQSVESEKEIGVVHYDTLCDTGEEVDYLVCGTSLNPEVKGSHTKIRMKGRKVYEYVLKNVPSLVKSVMDEAEVGLEDVNKVLLHQANGKMDHAMVNRLFRLYGKKADEIPHDIAPMTIQKYGNTSIATIPTMFDLIKKGKMEGHQINSGDTVVMASVGASMNANAVLYIEP